MQPGFTLLLVMVSQQPVGVLLAGPIIGVMGSLLGVLVGFFLANRQRRREEEQRARAIRRMLQTEIDHNLKELRDWRKRPSISGFPGQSNQIWDKQLPSIPRALQDEKIADAHDFYYQRHVLRIYLVEEKEEIASVARHSKQPARYTNQQYASLEKDLEKMVDVFLATYGNLRVLDEDD